MDPWSTPTKNGDHFKQLYFSAVKKVHKYIIVSTNEVQKPNLRPKLQKQPPRGVPRKKCSESMQQIYRRPPMLRCDFNKVAKHGWSPVNLLHIFRTPFPRTTSGWLLLQV